MIKRYRHWLGEEARHMVETFDGDYVLYTDHIAETRKLIDTYDLLISQEDKKIAELEAENKRLRELVDGARVIIEVFQWSTPAQERWREEWLKKAAKAMKEASHGGR